LSLSGRAGAIPAWNYSQDCGYRPSGGLGLVIVILIVLLVLGKIQPDKVLELAFIFLCVLRVPAVKVSRWKF